MAITKKAPNWIVTAAGSEIDAIQKPSPATRMATGSICTMRTWLRGGRAAKLKTKLNKYRQSGQIQRNGNEAISVVT